MKTIFLRCFTFIAVLYQAVSGMENTNIFNKLPKVLNGLIFQYVASSGPNFTNPLDLSLVCRHFYTLIHGNTNPSSNNAIGYKNLTPLGKNYINAWYGVTDENKDVFDIFLKGSLLYENTFLLNDIVITRKAEFKILDLPNPFFGSFDFSTYDSLPSEKELFQRVRISTGFRTKKIEANKGKIEMWVAPLFLVEKFLKTSASHFEPIMDKWRQNEKRQPIGIFYTSGDRDHLNSYLYVTKWSLKNISECTLKTLRSEANTQNINTYQDPLMFIQRGGDDCFRLNFID